MKSPPSSVFEPGRVRQVCITTRRRRQFARYARPATTGGARARDGSPTTDSGGCGGSLGTWGDRCKNRRCRNRLPPRLMPGAPGGLKSLGEKPTHARSRNARHLEELRGHPGPPGGRFRHRHRRGRGPHGRQRGGQIHPRQDRRRELPPERRGTSSWRASPRTSTGPSTRARRGSRSSTRTSPLCDNLTAAANVFLGREVKKSVGPAPLP